jgi:ribonuclease HI
LEASSSYDISGGTGLPTATFDGGAAQKLGVGGFTYSNEGGLLQMVRGRWYGEEKNTNNEAECQALVDLLETLWQEQWCNG